MEVVSSGAAALDKVGSFNTSVTAKACHRLEADISTDRTGGLCTDGIHPTARHPTPTVPRCLGPGSSITSPPRPMGHLEPYLYTNDLDGLTRALLPVSQSQLQSDLLTPSSGPAAGVTMIKVKHQTPAPRWRNRSRQV